MGAIISWLHNCENQYFVEEVLSFSFHISFVHITSVIRKKMNLKLSSSVCVFTNLRSLVCRNVTKDLIVQEYNLGKGTNACVYTVCMCVHKPLLTVFYFRSQFPVFSKCPDKQSPSPALQDKHPAVLRCSPSP